MKGFAGVFAVILYLYFLPLPICSINESKDHNNLTSAQLCAKTLLYILSSTGGQFPGEKIFKMDHV